MCGSDKAVSSYRKRMRITPFQTQLSVLPNIDRLVNFFPRGPIRDRPSKLHKG
jgi:hypothetical protein